MKASTKTNILKGLSKHIQGLVAVTTKHGIQVKGENGVLYAVADVYNAKTGEDVEAWFTLSETTTLQSLLNWLGY